MSLKAEIHVGDSGFVTLVSVSGDRGELQQESVDALYEWLGRLNDGRSTAEPANAPPCPVKKIAALYNELLGHCCIRLSDDLSEREKNSVRRLWRRNSKYQSLDFWKQHFSAMAQADWIKDRHGKLTFLNLVGSYDRFKADMDKLAGAPPPQKSVIEQWVEKE
jgi:hypothetical protein